MIGFILSKVLYFFKSMLTDKEWDPDCAKVLGMISVLISFVGFFMGLDQAKDFLYAGLGAIAMKCTGEFYNGQHS